MTRMEQLVKFVEWEKRFEPNRTHIAEWALNRIRELEAQIKADTDKTSDSEFSPAGGCNNSKIKGDE